METERHYIPIVSLPELVTTQPGLCRVQIDAAGALHLLTLNKGNRWVRRRLVEYLRDQIIAGDWRSDHPQPIVFSDSGRLIDGQHRLMAIAEAEVRPDAAVFVRIETGVEDSLREYLDTGITRSLADRVAFVSDEKSNKIIAQLCSEHTDWHNGQQHRASPEEAHEIFLLHKDAMIFVATYKKHDRGVGLITVAYAAMEYYERSPEKAEMFYPAVAYQNSDVQQARMLRDYLLRLGVTGASSRVQRHVPYYRAIGCMKAHMEGREVKIVRAAEW